MTKTLRPFWKFQGFRLFLTGTILTTTLTLPVAIVLNFCYCAFTHHFQHSGLLHGHPWRPWLSQALSFLALVNLTAPHPSIPNLDLLSHDQYLKAQAFLRLWTSSIFSWEKSYFSSLMLIILIFSLSNQISAYFTQNLRSPSTWDRIN